MSPEKRRKVLALLNDPAATENERKVCRKILKGTEVRKKRQRPPPTRTRPAAKEINKVNPYLDIIRKLFHQEGKPKDQHGCVVCKKVFIRNAPGNRLCPRCDDERIRRVVRDIMAGKGT
jgi:hypothetical protein